MKTKITKTILLIIINTSLVLLFWYFLDLSAFIISSILLTLLNSVLLIKKNTSSSILSSFLQKQYYKTKFRILNNSDNKKGLKKFLIKKTNTTYQKILFNLILLFKNPNSGYQVVREDVFTESEVLFTKIRKGERSDIKDILNITDKIKNQEQVKLEEIEKLDQLLLKFYKQKQQKFTRASAGTIALLIIATSTTSLISTLVFSGVNNIKAATYGWVQTDWTGGVDELATANHSDNQTDWTKVFSKDASVDTSTPGELSLTSTQVAITDTSDGDFNNTTMTNNSGGFYIVDGTIQLKKQDGATCTTNGECLGACISSVCASWIPGPCAGFEVYYEDSGAKDGLTGVNICAGLGGRLGTSNEVKCMVQNKSSYGNNFNQFGYWTSTRYTAYVNNYYFIRTSDAATLYSAYTTIVGIRCIR